MVHSITLPGYSLGQKLGEGGMAQVYQAQQISLNRAVALKILAPQLAIDEQFGKRFVLEGRTLAQLNHPNIVRVYDAGQVDRIFYIAMELLDSASFKERLNAGCDINFKINTLSKIARALAAVHRAGFIHRDLKPENILFRNGEEIEPVLADFGIAKDHNANSELTEVDTVIGSPRFMSPEQALGLPLDYRTDIFSFGVLLFYALTLKTPFDASTIGQLVLEHRNKIQPQLPGYLQVFQPLLDSLLAVDPNKRLSDAGAIATALAAIDTRAIIPITAAQTVVLPVDANGHPIKVNKSRNFVPWILGTLAGGILIFGGYYFFGRTHPPSLISSEISTLQADRVITPAPDAVIDPWRSQVTIIPSYATVQVLQQRTLTPQQTEFTLYLTAPGYMAREVAVNYPGDALTFVLRAVEYLSPKEVFAYQLVLAKELSIDAFLRKFPLSLFAPVVSLQQTKDTAEINDLDSAAQNGDIVAQLQLSEIYDQGIAVGKNAQLALKWAATAADLGSPIGRFQKSILVLQHSKDSAEINTAIKDLNDLSQANHFMANDVLAGLYLEGRYVKKDVPTAIKLLKVSAQEGDYTAHTQLAELYTRGVMAKNEGQGSIHLLDAKRIKNEILQH